MFVFLLPEFFGYPFVRFWRGVNFDSRLFELGFACLMFFDKKTLNTSPKWQFDGDLRGKKSPITSTNPNFPVKKRERNPRD